MPKNHRYFNSIIYPRMQQLTNSSPTPPKYKMNTTTWQTISSLVRSATANRPEETCNHCNGVDCQQPANPIFASTSRDTLAVDNHNRPPIHAPTNNPRLSSTDLQPQVNTQQPTPSTALDHITLPLISLDQNWKLSRTTVTQWNGTCGTVFSKP